LDYKTYLRGQSGELTVALVMEHAQAGYQPQPGARDQPGASAWRRILHPLALQPGFFAFPKPGTRSQSLPRQLAAEVARLEVANQARALEIETPLHDWNLVFKAMQDQANLLVKKRRILNKGCLSLTGATPQPCWQGL
jgi:hypothetical protein